MDIAKLFYKMIKDNIYSFEKVPARWKPEVQKLFDRELQEENNEVYVDTHE